MEWSPVRRNSLPVLGITMGDPAGIGPEVIAKGLARHTVQQVCRPIVIGSTRIMENTVRRLRLPLRIHPVGGHGEAFGRRGEVSVLDPLGHPLGRFAIGKVGARTGEASVAFIKKGVHLAEAGCIDAVVTGPINKEAINLAGYRFPGHTEMLADLTRSKDVGMMIVGGAAEDYVCDHPCGDPEFALGLDHRQDHEGDPLGSSGPS